MRNKPINARVNRGINSTWFVQARLHTHPPVISSIYLKSYVFMCESCVRFLERVHRPHLTPRTRVPAIFTQSIQSHTQSLTHPIYFIYVGHHDHPLVELPPRNLGGSFDSRLHALVFEKDLTYVGRIGGQTWTGNDHSSRQRTVPAQVIGLH